jgi:hypothetical protein
VAEVVCVVCANDEALLAEVAAHRKLARLGLRLLAPTVMASSAPLDTTLAALRDAGYAPVPVGPDGTSTIQRTVPAHATATPTHTDATALSAATTRRPDPGGVVDPLELAARLQAAAAPAEPMSEHQARAMIAKHAAQLSVTEQFNLQYLVSYGLSTRVEATVDGGATRLWTLEKGELDGDVLHAWCPDVGDYETLPLSAITKVRR